MTHPAKLGKYQITGVLGEGAMGVVYRGFDPDIRRVVALKTIRHQPGASPEARDNSAARFRNEAQAAGRLLHPGIVGVYDFGEASDGAGGRVAYIAMEFVEGHTLAHYLSQRVAFNAADLASVGHQVLDALGHAHEYGVWHRDVKPSNVIMTKTGRVKIADFGIARTDTAGLTMANSVLGTPMYMAPEQFMGRQFDHRVDLYAVGVLLYQLIAGRAPFLGSPEQLMFKVVNDVPPPPSTVEGAPLGYSQPVFDALVGRAMAKDPQHRFPNATAFRDALTQALGQPVPTMVSRETVYAVPMPGAYAPTERVQRVPAAGGMPPTGGSGTLSMPTNWDPVALAKVEAALARVVGPMASVMVRRAARECHDIPTLYQRLGEQITQESARKTFLGLVSTSGPGTASTSAVPSGGASRGGGTGGSGASGSTYGTSTNGVVSRPVTEALLDQAQRILAAHLGPIAKVVVRRAAERTRQREPLLMQLLEAVPEAARAQVKAEFAKLP